MQDLRSSMVWRAISTAWAENRQITTRSGSACFSHFDERSTEVNTEQVMRSVLGAIVFATCVEHSAAAQKNWNAPHVVVAYCSGCHGINGDAQLSYFPKLAGLDPKYAARKLGAFKENSAAMDEPYRAVLNALDRHREQANLTHNERTSMEGVAHAVAPERIQEAVRWYAAQPAVSGHVVNRAQAEQGKEVFTRGIPAQHVTACITCHGPNAEGQGPAPRLAGQNAEYIEIQ